MKIPSFRIHQWTYRKWVEDDAQEVLFDGQYHNSQLLIVQASDDLYSIWEGGYEVRLLLLSERYDMIFPFVTQCQQGGA